MAKQIKASDIFEDEDIFRGIKQSAEEAITTLGKFKKEISSTADALKKTLTANEAGDTKAINEMIQATQKANDLKEKSIHISKAEADLRKTIAQAEKAETQAKKENLTLLERENKAREKAAKQAQQEESAYNKLSKTLNESRKRYKDLAVQNKENTVEAQKLLAEIQDLDAQIKKVDATVGQHQRNVGNYEGATMSLRTELRKLTQELANMDEADPRFNQMAQRAGELRDRMQDTQGVIQATAGTGMENLAGAMANVGQVGIAAFQGVESAMILMGVENENLMKAMVRLQALAGLADAMRTLGGLGDMMTQIKAGFIAAAEKLGILVAIKEVDVVATEAQTVAMVSQTTATEAASAATQKYQLTMKALPIALIATAVVALIANFDKVAALFDRTSQKTKVLNETMNSYADAAKGVIKQTTEVKASFELARKGVISKEEALDKYNSVLGATFGTAKNLNEAEELYAKKTAAYVKATGLRAQADTIFQKVAEERVNALLQEREAAKFAKQASSDFFSLTGNLSKSAKEMAKNSNARATEFEKIAMELLKEAEVLENNFGIRSEYDQKIAESKKKKEKNTKDEIKLNEDLKKSLEELRTEYQNVNFSQEALLAVERERNAQRLIEEHKVSTDLLNRDAQLKEALLLNEQEYLRKLKELRQEKELTVAETEVNKIKLQMKNASGLRLIALTVQLKEAELKVLQEQEEKELEAAGKNEELKAKIRSEYALKRQQVEEDSQLKYLKEEEKNDKKELDLLKMSIEKRNEWAKFAADYFIEQSKRKMAQLDKEISNAEKQQNMLQELAANGNINAKESLAEQQRIIDDANRKKAQEERRQQMIQLASSVYATYNQKLAENSEHPLMETMRDAVLLQQFANTLIGQMPTFLEGTEDTGTNGRGVDGKGGFHAILHPNERVVPKSLNEQIGAMSNEQLARIAQEYQTGKIVRGSEAGSSLDLAVLVNKLDTLTDTIKAKPETNIELGEITSSMMEIVKRTKQGNTLKTNRYKIRK